jgi:glutamine synthetase
VPDAATLRPVPWEEGRAWMLADLHATGLCSRGALRRMLARLAAFGLEAVFASELEFYLLREGADGSLTPYSPLVGMAYTTGRRSDPQGVARDILDSLDGVGVPVTAALREFSPGQFEVNLLHGEALAAADHAFLLKEVVRERAAAFDLFASFMAKPFETEEGSSHHVHVSLWRDGANTFAGDADGLLSPLARHFANGILHHARAITAVAAQTVNSYKRLGGVGLAPAVAELCGDDRNAFLRLPPEGGRAARLELRVGDASANPYLLYCALLAAGLDGVERALDAPLEPPVLPRTLAEALDAFAADPVVRAGLGDHLADALIAVKRREVERFGRAVTDWERREYLRNA